MGEFDFIKEENGNSYHQNDKKAIKEQEFILSQDGKRNEGVKNVTHWIFLWILRIAFVLICIVLITRVFHLILPNCLRWLGLNDISQMDKFLFSSSLGGIIGKYFSSIFNSKK